jgi:hypothetical protein
VLLDGPQKSSLSADLHSSSRRHVIPRGGRGMIMMAGQPVNEFSHWERHEIDPAGDFLQSGS